MDESCLEGIVPAPTDTSNFRQLMLANQLLSNTWLGHEPGRSRLATPDYATGNGCVRSRWNELRVVCFVRAVYMYGVGM